MSKLIPKETILKIKNLRSKGYSLPEIQREVGVGAGSVFRHIHGVKILPEYVQQWHMKRGGSFKRMKMREKQAVEKANDSIPSVSTKEKLIFLTALYWGEGSKGDLNLMNSDPELVRVFVQGLKEVFQVPGDHLRVSIRIYEDLDRQKCLQYWSNITGIPAEEFVSVDVIEGRKKGKLPYGMCRIRVLKGCDLLKYMKALRVRISSLFALVA